MTIKIKGIQRQYAAQTILELMFFETQVQENRNACLENFPVYCETQTSMDDSNAVSTW